MSAAAVIAMRRRRLIRRFREAGATRPEMATSLDSIHERNSWIFRRMARRGVFLQAGPDLFYMDEQAALLYQQAARRRAVGMAAFFLILFLLFLILRQSMR